MRRVVGIDLGTTFSPNSVFRRANWRAELYSRAVRLDFVPVGCERGPRRQSDRRRAGAREVADATGAHNLSVKRLMGRGVADVQDELKIFPFRIDPGSDNVIRVRLGDKSFTPPEISAYILAS